MKKVISISAIMLVVCALCVFLAPGATVEAEALTSGYYTYTVSNGEATITDISTSISGDITIPSTLGGYPVTAIGDDTIINCDSLTSVTIPDGVTYIGLQAFNGCDSLTCVNIPASVSHISTWAFGQCDKLTSVYVDSNNANYMSRDGVLFDKDKTCIKLYPCGKTETTYTIPSSVTHVGDAAFQNCDNLTSVTIGDSVTSIGDEAFSCCDSLTSVTIPDSVTSIHLWAFESCTSLTSVTIPDSVTTIDYDAFYQCTRLKDVWYEGDSQSNIVIEDGNDELTSATWHYNSCMKNTETYEHKYDNVCDVDCNVCGNTRNDAHSYEWVVDVEPDCGVEGSKHEECTLCGAKRNENTIIEALPINFTYTISNGQATITGYTGNGGDVVIPSSIDGYPVATINKYAFENCWGLTSVTIPDSVTSIGSWAFACCDNLMNINVNSDNVNYTSQDGVLFSKDKTKLVRFPAGRTASYIIPDGVITIDIYAFGHSRTLKSVVIPESVTTICDEAFFCCPELTNIVIPESIETIGNNSFAMCHALTSVVVPDSVTYIGDYAFACCTGLTSVIIPDSVTSIGEDAFYGCDSLKDVWYEGDSQSNISIDSNNSYLTSATWHYNCCMETTETFAHKYDDDCDEYCNACGNIRTDAHSYEWVVDVEPDCGVEGSKHEECTLCGAKRNEYTIIEALPINFTYTISNGQATITGYTGNGGDVVIPLSIDGYPVTTIGDDAFYWCDSLKSVTIPNSVTYIGNRAFDSCKGLERVTIPDSITYIGNGAFYWCVSLTSVTIPNSVTYIGSAAFNWCENLTSIMVNSDNANYSSQGGVLFNKDKTILIQYPAGKRETIYTIPASVISIGESAFDSCWYLTSVTISNSVTYIGESAFNDCTDITSVTIGYSVTSIGEYAFSSCRSLTSVTIPNSVAYIGDYAFDYCTSLTDVWYEGDSQLDITIDSGNTELISAIWHYNCCMETTETFAHKYDDDCDEYCNACGNIRTDAHNFTWIIDIESGCTAIGSKHEECSLCGTTRNENTVVEALGHSYDNSCDITCNICTDEREITHSYEWITDIEPTCGVAGAKHEKCSVCHTTRNENTVIEPTGEHYVLVSTIETVTTVSLTNHSTYPFTLSDGIYTSTNKTGSSTSYFDITALNNCTITIEYGVSSESNYDWLTIYKNASQLDKISGIVSNKTLTVSMVAGDYVRIEYKKDSSVNKNSDEGYFAITAGDTVRVETLTRISTELIEPTCTEAVICSVCNTEVKAKAPHTWTDKDITVEPTCVKAGEKIVECFCGETKIDVVEPTGVHLFDNEEDEDCNNCGLVKYVVGELDGSEGLNDTDAIYLLLHTYFPNDYPVSQDCDFDGDGEITEDDAIHLLFYTYFPTDYPLPEPPFAYIGSVMAVVNDDE